MGVLVALVVLGALFRPIRHLTLWVLGLLVAAIVAIWHALLWVFWIIFGISAVARLGRYALAWILRARPEPDSYRWRPGEARLPIMPTRRAESR